MTSSGPDKTGGSSPASTQAAAGSTAGPEKQVSTATTVDVLEERLIDAEYKIWKKNTPYLYDFVLTHSLEWPSLTCQWLPTVRSTASATTTTTTTTTDATSSAVAPPTSEHSMLLGTHTTGEQNYLMVASCALPRETPAATPANQPSGGGGAAAAANKNTSSATATTVPHYDEEKKEVGGFGLASANVGKIEIKMKVKHEGEVNRARYMPQNHFIVATRGPNPEVYIFDLSKHPSVPSKESPFSPQGVCVGHSKEGYSMAWSHHTSGLLATGSEDATVKLWDVTHAIPTKGAEPGYQIPSLHTLAGHTLTVEDVDWNAKDPHMLGTVGDDRTIGLWDTRKPDSFFHQVPNAHTDDINCIAFNPTTEYLFATGSADKTVCIWDTRKLKSPTHTLKGHNDQVYKVEWAPHHEAILGSCSADRRVAIWDLARIGREQTAEDAEDGPPELLFLHGGHTSKVSDFGWNSNYPWTIASVSEDNVLQVWNMAEEIYADDDDDDQDQSDDENDIE